MEPSSASWEYRLVSDKKSITRNRLSSISKTAKIFLEFSCRLHSRNQNSTDYVWLEVLLSLLYCNKICKTILTCPAIHDTLYRKSHRACRGNAPPSCLRKTALPLKSPTGAFIATQTRSCRKVQNGEDLFPMKIFTVPQHTRSILPLTSSDKIIAALRGRYFSFSQIKSYVVVQVSEICF